MRTPVVALGASLGWVAVAACTQAFSPVDQLVSPRVLALRSEPAELLPDAGVTLEALVYVPNDPTGASASTGWSWCPELGGATEAYACALTADTLAAALAADGGLSVSFDAGTGTSVYFRWPLDASLLQALCGQQPGQGDGGVEDAGVDGGSDGGGDGGTFAGAGLRLTCGGNALTVTLEFDLSAAGTSVRAQRTLTAAFSTPTTLNQNPTALALTAQADGGSLVHSGEPLAAGGAYTLTVSLGPDASEPYQGTVFVSSDAGADGGQEDAGGPGPSGRAETVTLYEGLSVAWYVEQGTLASATTALDAGRADDAGLDLRDFTPLLTNTWTVPATTRGVVRVIGVVRDTRAGVGWVNASFQVVGGAP